MDFVEAVRARRMVRSFAEQPVDPALLDDLLELARRAPSAGNTQGWGFLVLDTPEDCARYWDTTLEPQRRVGFAWPGLLRAPVLVVPYGDPDAYVDRYAEPDKAATGLGEGMDAWPVPYWLVDAAFATMSLLLATVDAGLGACLFGQFHHESAVRDAFGVPHRMRAVGTVAIGHPDGGDRPGRSARRGRVPLEELVHRSRW